MPLYVRFYCFCHFHCSHNEDILALAYEYSRITLKSQFIMIIPSTTAIPPAFCFKSVLLIDDNELDIFINTTFIKREGFSEKIFTATSARSALEFLSNLEQMGENQGQNYPQLFVVDLNMPVINGFQFLEILITSEAYLKYKPTLVLLTSSTFNEDRLSAAAISKDILFLNKPLNADLLRNIAEKKTAISLP